MEAKYYRNFTALHKASENGHFDIVKVKYLIDNRIQLCDEKWRSKIVVEKQKFNTVSHELVVYNLQLQHPYHIFIFISTKKKDF